MKGLCIKQPYAALICAGLKVEEYRTRQTNFRGSIIVIATSTSCSVADESELFKEYIDVLKKDLTLKYEPKLFGVKDKRVYLKDESYKLEFEFLQKFLWQYKRGNDIFDEHMIIGKVDIVDCVAYNNKYKWILENAVLFENPVKQVKGFLGIRDVPIKYDGNPFIYDYNYYFKEA